MGLTEIEDDEGIYMLGAVFCIGNPKMFAVRGSLR